MNSFIHSDIIRILRSISTPLSIHAIPFPVCGAVHLQYICDAFAKQLPCIRGVFAVHSRCIRGAFAKQMPCIRGAFAVHLRRICGAFAVHVRCICDAFAMHLRCTCACVLQAALRCDSFYRQPCVAMRRLCFATVNFFLFIFLFNSRSQKLLDRFS